MLAWGRLDSTSSDPERFPNKKVQTDCLQHECREIERKQDEVEEVEYGLDVNYELRTVFKTGECHIDSAGAHTYGELVEYMSVQ